MSAFNLLFLLFYNQISLNLKNELWSVKSIHCADCPVHYLHLWDLSGF